MENTNSLKTLVAITLWGALLVIPFFVLGYDDKTTHPALTQEIIKFFNASFPENKISDEDKELIIQGSMDEDETPRWMQHFYDPVHDRGLVLVENELNQYQGLAAIIAGARAEFQSSKQWAEDTVRQAGFNGFGAGILTSYFGDADDHSWERAIYEYAWGNKKRGLNSLGHVLHLLEDASVPDHTRNDPHPPVLDLGSPYEHWTKKFTRENIIINGMTGTVPTTLPTLNAYFDSIASYSNKNFFSEDTITSRDYSEPVEESIKLEEVQPGIFLKYGVKNNYRLVLYTPNFEWNLDKTSSIDDERILTDYWSLLSKQTVLHGAGVVKLFFDEVEKEGQTKTLYEKNKSWIGKTWASIVGFFGFEGDDKTSTPQQNPPPELTPPLPPPPQPTPAPPQPAAVTTPPQTQPQTPQPIPPPPPPAPTPPPAPPPVLPPPFVPSDTSDELPFAGIGGAPPPPPAPETTETPPPPPPEPSPPPKDTTPPDINLTISECNQSLSPEGCLIATTTITLEWESDAEDLSYYTLGCNVNSTSCENFPIATTTATTTTYTLVQDNALYTFTAQATDHDENTNNPAIQTIEIATRPVVINEIAWAGTSASRSQDEWIELYNPTTQPVELSLVRLKSLTDAKPNIQLSGTIPAGGYYIIERTDDTTISDIAADLITSFGSGSGTGLANGGETLALEYRGVTLDQTPDVNACSGWCGGGAGDLYHTMERFDPRASGEQKENWGHFAGFLAQGKNADGIAVHGTPKQRNSINHLIVKEGSVIPQDTTLSKTRSPYLIRGNFLISQDRTLTIPEDITIKFFDANSSLTIDGTFIAQGTVASPVAFTSLKDDAIGGDTNQDGATTTPDHGDWSGIHFTSTSKNSVIRHALIRYGGHKAPGGGNWANLLVTDSALTLEDATISHSGMYGIKLKNASGKISGNIIEENRRIAGDSVPFGMGVLVEGGAPEITKNTIRENTKGIMMENTAAVVTENTFSKNLQEAIYAGNVAATFKENKASENGLNGILLSGTFTPAGEHTLFEDLPYVIRNGSFSVSAGKTLKLEPGVVIKMAQASLAVDGTLIAVGEAENKVIFTSLNDDEYGGDTNATSTAPQTGDWDVIQLGENSGPSLLQNVIIRYGGTRNSFNPTKGALNANRSTVTVDHATIEKNYFAGIALKNATSTVSDSLIQNHTEPATSYGINAENSSLEIKNTTFKNNAVGIFTDAPALFTNGGGNTFENNTTNTQPPDLLP